MVLNIIYTQLTSASSGDVSHRIKKRNRSNELHVMLIDIVNKLFAWLFANQVWMLCFFRK